MTSNMLLGTLGASLLGNLLTGKRQITTSQGQVTFITGECSVRTGQDF